MKSELSNLCYFVDGRVAVAKLNLDTYISTENMLPNKAGITRSAGLPSVSLTQAYQAGDVLVSNIRPYFRKIWFANCDGGCSNDVLVLRANKNIYPNFLYYLLSDDRFFDYATVTAKGTKMPRGDKGAIMRYEVPDLSLDIQIKIAEVLSSLDDKIDLLTRQNATLEALAQTYFRQWFVVEASEDWEEKPFTEIADILGGGTPNTTVASYWNGDIPWFTPKDATSLICNNTEKYITHDGLDHCNSKLYPSGTVFISARGTVGKISICGVPMAVNQSCYALVGKGKIPNFIVYLIVSYLIAELQMCASGAVFDAITTDTFKAIKIPLPSIDDVFYVKTYEKLVIHYDKICSNTRQIQTLQKLRDTLLPKLISGEVEVKI